MLKLFTYEGYKVNISPEALLLKPFRQIYQRDRSASKERALLELGFIYFYCDPRSDYQYITDDEARMEAIKLGEGLSSTWKPDKLIYNAIEFYESFHSTASLLLKDTRVAVDKLRTLLKDIDLDERDDKRKPIHTLNTIISTIKQVPSLIKELDEVEKAIAKEFTSNTRMRGSAEKALFEDGF